ELVQAEFINGMGNCPVQQVRGEVTLYQIVLRPAVQGLHGNLLAPLAGQQHHWTALRVWCSLHGCKKLQPIHIGQAKIQYQAVWPSRVVEGQALCTTYGLDARISCSQMPAKEAATRRAILGAVVDNQDGQGDLCCHAAFFLPLGLVEAYVHGGAIAMGGGSGLLSSWCSFLMVSLSVSITPLWRSAGMVIPGYIVCTSLRRSLVPLQGQASRNKAYPWGASSTVTDSTLYSRSPQKSVAKNFRKESKTLQSPGFPRYPKMLFPFLYISPRFYCCRKTENGEKGHRKLLILPSSGGTSAIWYAL